MAQRDFEHTSDTKLERTSDAAPRNLFLALLPNGLSLLRLGLGLAFPWLPQPWRLWVVLIGGFTDLIDGELGRRLGATTSTGRILDPIADKTFVLAVLATLLWEGLLLPWEAVLVGLRDLAVLTAAAWLGLRGRWALYRRMRPRLLGKVTTGAQFLLLLSLLYYQEPSPFLFWLTALVSFLAAVDYFWAYFKKS